MCHLWRSQVKIHGTWPSRVVYVAHNCHELHLARYMTIFGGKNAIAFYKLLTKETAKMYKQTLFNTEAATLQDVEK